MDLTIGPLAIGLNLPIEARRGIASILSECEAGLVWPHQVMQNAVALLGKSATDDRAISCLNGKHCVDTFLDLEKFCDSIDNVKLIQQACQLKWNPDVLKMSLLVRMTPRVLRIGDLWREWISPCNSIVQGCGSSNSWAERCCTGCYKTYTPVFLFKLASKSTTSLITARVLFEAT